MKNKPRILVPEDDTHKQNITDVYKIYKTSFSKCYDSDEEIFFSDVVHHLELHSASTKSEADSYDKYGVDNTSLDEALSAVPTWPSKLPSNYGFNVAVSLSYINKDLPEDSPLNYLEDMGVEMIEYVKLRIGYNYLKANLGKVTPDDRYEKAFCPGLTSGFEDPIVLRMIHTQYIKGEDYLKWILRSRRKEDVKKREMISPTVSQALNTAKSESTWKMWKEQMVSGSQSSTGKDDIFFDSTPLDDKSRKDDMEPLSANEKQHIIMLTQYEVTDQELPDDIEVFWPGKRDHENDFASFKNALSQSVLHQKFIQKFKSGKLDRLEDDAKRECKEFFKETQRCQSWKFQVKTPQATEKKQTREPKKCSWEKLKEQFKDYKISQEITLSLFDNVIKEKTKIEDLNLFSIINKLREIHKENPKEGENEGELIWKDMVIIKTKTKSSDEDEKEDEEVINVIRTDDTADEKSLENEEDEETDDEDYDVAPEFTSMIYVTKVYPSPGIGYREDKCPEDYSQESTVALIGLEGGCTGYSMKDYIPPLMPHCFDKISTNYPGNPPPSYASSKAKDSSEINVLSKLSLKSQGQFKTGDYVTFHTDWSNYPYTQMLDIIFHRHHKGYIYMTDVFEIKPDTLREIERIFHKTGKYSEAESRKNAINSYLCQDPQAPPSCCRKSSADSESNDEDFPFPIPPNFTNLGVDKLMVKQTLLPNNTNCNTLPFFPNADVGEFIKIQNIRIEKNKDDNYKTKSSSSSNEIDNESDTNYYFERFQSPRVSSIGFDSHNTDIEDDKYPVQIDFSDFSSSGSKQVDDNDDDYSDIVDFIKNFRFSDEKPNKPTNYEKPNKPTNYEKPEENPETKGKGLFVDLLSSDSSLQSNKQYIQLKKSRDIFSVNSEDSLSLKDVKGLMEKHDICEVQAERLHHKVSGEYYDVIIEKRRAVLQEIRTCFPLLYLYFTLKTNFSKINITGKLFKYRKYFQTIEQEYKTIVTQHSLNERDISNKVKKLIPHQHLRYEEIFGKHKAFKIEIFSMAYRDPFIRHLVIREAFQDVGTNLSFFLLQFIENDRFNLLYSQGKNEPINYDKIIKEVGNFLQTFRYDSRYKRFLLENVIIHFFQAKKYFTLDKLMQLDLNWEDIFKISRSLSTEENPKVKVNYKDSVLQSCTSYSYLFYNIIKRFNNLFLENVYFKQFLNPELHPMRINDLCCTEMDELITEECAQFCDNDLVHEVELDLHKLERTIWECEILGRNHCILYTSQIINRFPHETANYFHYFFTNIIQVKAHQDTSSTESPKEICQYNREFHCWHGKCDNSNDLLKKNNLYHFEKLLTICLLRSILTFYEYKYHG